MAALRGLLATCVLAMSGTSAIAGVPDPVCFSIVPPAIRVGGMQTSAAEPDPSLEFTIAIIDCEHQPRRNVRIVLDFMNCSDTRLCAAVVGGQVTDCVARTVDGGTTDENGEARLSIIGGGVNAGTTVPPAIAAGMGSGCIRVYGDGVLIALSTAVVYDQNGALPGGNGVNALDLAIAKNDVGASGLGAPYRGRSDYTGDSAVNGADLAVLKRVVGQSGIGLGSGSGCAGGDGSTPYCP